MSSGFFQLFLNQSGLTELTVKFEDNKEKIVTLEITSKKVQKEVIGKWYQKIAETFPIFSSNVFVTPLSFMRAQKAKSNFYSSFTSYLNDIDKFLQNLLYSVKTVNYFKTSIQRVSDTQYVGNFLTEKNINTVLSKPEAWQRATINSKNRFRKGLNFLS